MLEANQVLKEKEAGMHWFSEVKGDTGQQRSDVAIGASGQQSMTGASGETAMKMLKPNSEQLTTRCVISR
jgi:hypothetical protein